MTRNDLIRVVAIILAGAAVLYALGYGTWNPWPQLLAGTALLIVASTAAPVAFGWRDDAPHRGHPAR